MPRKIPHRNLPQLLLKAREQLLCHFRPIITHFGLTEQQWRILRCLDEHQQLEPREIGELCQILSPSLAGVLARMEDMGLVSRVRMPADQRRVLVRLTPKSEAIAAQMVPLIKAQYRHIEEAYGPELIDLLYTILDKLTLAEGNRVGRVTLPPKKDGES